MVIYVYQLLCWCVCQEVSVPFSLLPVTQYVSFFVIQVIIGRLFSLALINLLFLSFFSNLPVYLFVCLLTYILFESVCLSVCQYIHLSACFYWSQPINLSLQSPSRYRSICLCLSSTSLFVWLLLLLFSSILLRCLPAANSLYLPASQYTHQYVCLLLSFNLLP